MLKRETGAVQNLIFAQGKLLTLYLHPTFLPLWISRQPTEGLQKVSYPGTEQTQTYLALPWRRLQLSTYGLLLAQGFVQSVLEANV